MSETLQGTRRNLRRPRPRRSIYLDRPRGLLDHLPPEDRQTASNRTPRQINRDLIFEEIRTKQPISRAELSRSSGLQRSTITNIIDELLEDKWVVESAIGASLRGRKPMHLTLNPCNAVVAVDIHPAQTTVAVADLSGKISSEARVTVPSDRSRAMAAIVRAIQNLIAHSPNLTFQGIGISLPGRFSRALDKTIFAPNVPWPIEQIKTLVEKATGLPVAVDNVANACALSEVWFGYSERSQDLVVVNVSEGIGTGIFANGRLLRGSNEGAGEFGQVQIDPHGVRCGCGSRGCWETLASNRAGLRYYQQLTGKTVDSFELLVHRAERGEPDAQTAISQMAESLGRGLHMVVLALAPSQIVVVGEIARLWSLAGPVIEKALQSFPMIGVPVIRTTEYPEQTRLRSAVALIMDEKCWMARTKN